MKRKTKFIAFSVVLVMLLGVGINSYAIKIYNRSMGVQGGVSMNMSTGQVCAEFTNHTASSVDVSYRLVANDGTELDSGTCYDVPGDGGSKRTRYVSRQGYDFTDIEVEFDY